MTGNVNVRRGAGIFDRARGEGVKSTILRLVAMKNDLVRAATAMSEILADKTAREGLFGEDRGLGYCGTDVDFIPENAKCAGELSD